MNIPPPYTCYPILIKSCTCGRRLGCLQRKIEERILLQQQITPSLPEARSIVLREMGFTKICCLEQITNCAKIPVNDLEGEDAYNDITTLQNGTIYQNNRLINNTGVATWSWLPSSRGKIQFDEKKYSQDIYNELYGPSVNISSTRNAFPTFPKFLSQMKQPTK